MTDAGLYQFATRVNHVCVKSMDLSYCRSLSDDSIEALAKKCTNLEFLNLSGVNRITDEGAKVMSRIKAKAHTQHMAPVAYRFKHT